MNQDFLVGDEVKVLSLPKYLKTAEPMSMLRPPDLIEVGEQGVIIDRRPGNYWVVRFRRGTFLMENQYLKK
jgi:Protein of unknown function (DUF3148)